MIRYNNGNMLESDAEALVNPVNEVGVMGKGLELAFRDAFPENMRAYKLACDRDEVHVGEMFVVQNHAPAGPRWIINFPTKKHWRNASKFEWITSGLTDLARVITERDIKSVALPALGCGLGGLDWTQVRTAIERELGRLDNIDIRVFEPAITRPSGAADTETRH